MKNVVSLDQKNAIQNVLEFGEVLKMHFPGLNLVNPLTEHIISIVEDYDPETIYKEMNNDAYNRMRKEMEDETGTANPYEE